MEDNQELLRALSDAVVGMDEDAARVLAGQALSSGLDASDVLSRGLIPGMKAVGEKYEAGEYFVPELLLCSDALYAGLDVLRPHLLASQLPSAGRVVIGVVEGDTHDIGKNIVRIMLEGSGFEVVDLGANVPHHFFVDAAVQHRADIIALSSLMATAMEGMGAVIDILARRGLRDQFKVMVGGSPVSAAFARKIGADGYAPNATGAVRLAHSLVSSSSRGIGAAPRP
ncbi:MAG: corrinoid protein [Chloroflexota bacterium]|nr:corrinoid protein [Chloroflexota bacterium]